MPGIDAAETLAVPIWLAGAAAVAFVVAILLAVKRAGGVALITSLFRICLAVALGAWLHGGSRDTSERRALDDRKMVLMAGSIAPGSALSCLDELAAYPPFRVPWHSGAGAQVVAGEYRRGDR
jgi:hypothetical protein